MSNTTELTDEQLIERITTGDQAALAELYARYGTPVYSICRRALGNPALAEEAAQDTFMKVWRNPAAWDAKRGRFSSWLLTVARYTAIDLLRAEQRQPTDTAEPIEDMHLAAGTGRPDDPLLRDGHLLRSLIAQLPPEQAQVVTMGFFHGYTHSDLAEKLDLPLGTVKTRVRLGLQKLRQMWLDAHKEPESPDIHP
jgi:RNA polymerase sigma-70 factor (ECF subfamily)